MSRKKRWLKKNSFKHKQTSRIPREVKKKDSVAAVISGGGGTENSNSPRWRWEKEGAEKDRKRLRV